MSWQLRQSNPPRHRHDGNEKPAQKAVEEEHVDSNLSRTPVITPPIIESPL